MKRQIALALGIALLAAAGATEAGPARPTVAVDFAALDQAAYQRLDALALEQRVVVRLAQEGFAVVARSGAPDILIRLRVLADRVVIEDAAAPAQRRREVMTRDDPVRELSHLEIAQKIVELARASRAALPPPPPVIAPPPPPAGPDLELAGGAGGLWRSGGTDGQLGLDVRLGQPRGRGLRATALFTRAPGGGVDADEIELQVGFGERLAAAGRVDVELALLVGGLLHHYSVDGDPLRPSGTRFDGLASLPVITTFWGARRSLGLALRLAPGLTGRERQHTLDGQTVWRRGALRVEAGADLVWRL